MFLSTNSRSCNPSVTGLIDLRMKDTDTWTLPVSRNDVVGNEVTFCPISIIDGYPIDVLVEILELFIEDYF